MRTFVLTMVALLAIIPSAQAEMFRSQPMQLSRNDVTLHGTFEQPLTTKPTPVVLIIAGSGPTDRNGNNPLIPGSNDSLKQLAQSLASQGIATLRYDKRGIGESKQENLQEANLRFETYVNDAAAWLAELERRGYKQRYVIGHSEGGLIATLAARLQKVDAVILLCAAGRPADQIIREQLTSNAPHLVDDATRIMNVLKQGQLVAKVPTELASLFRPSVQPYLQSWFRYDPAREADQLGTTVFSLSGATDIQVGAEDATRLAEQNNIRHREIPEMNHVLKHVASKDTAAQQNAYTNPVVPLAPELVPTLAQFILGGKARE
ncbi:alpha/beta hydrolase [Permianibacter aggregans]|uniref:Serine aminopeptidase S33 domain-containing protein n=1 Tax=Permianibacter aggregans TaxID=1510150 RepID=A0A4R6UG88_9GAMM|nr:alpha/beta fold hydrolase [Permianibacter aggregans]TDQ45788.1 hypothetical protein EV696_11721 [Permianibacter aggregans]